MVLFSTRNEKVRNKLSSDEFHAIWKPELSIEDTNIFHREINEPPSILIIKESNFYSNSITIYLLSIGISRENRKFPKNFLFCFDFTINSKYVILFHFESNQGGKVNQSLGAEKSRIFFYQKSLERSRLEKFPENFLFSLDIPIDNK